MFSFSLWIWLVIFLLLLSSTIDLHCFESSAFECIDDSLLDAVVEDAAVIHQADAYCPSMLSNRLLN
uniref:Secreted protein n=1 Tax=Arundo donax TaxID=35708 RepID=A0A0A9GXC6_ARUDO